MYPALLADAWQANWLLFDKVDFNGIDRTIHVHPDVTLLDIREDIYTSWVDWLVLEDNIKFLPALRTTGMDPIGGGKFTGDVYFLINGWKLYVDLSRVRITGVLFSDDYDSAYFTPNGVQQYPVTVAALVNTVAVASASGAPTAEENALATWGMATSTPLPGNSFGKKLIDLENISLPITYPLSTSDKDDVAQRVWDRPVGTSNPGSFGEFVSKKLLTVSKFLGLS